MAEIACSVRGKEGVSTSGFAGELATGSANCIFASSSCRREVCCFRSSVSGALAAGTCGGGGGGTSAGAGFTSKKGERLDKSTNAGIEGASEGANRGSGLPYGP